MAKALADNPTLIYNAFLEGLSAEAPKSFPYLALFCAYGIGKPGESSQFDEQTDTSWASYITSDEMEVMRTIINNAKARMGGAAQPVIDIASAPSAP